MMQSFDTLIEALQTLKAQGYTYDFNLLDTHIHCPDLTTTFGPDDFEVVEIYRFEGMSNPADNTILYVVETKTGVKGLLLDSYGAYSGQISEEMLDKLSMRHHST